MNTEKDFFIIIKPKLKQAYISYWSDLENLPDKIELIYSDKLEDISTQLFFMGYKLLEHSKKEYMHMDIICYDIISI